MIDWNKFTNFRSKNTRKDLERLLNQLGKSKSRRKEALEQPDRAGLYPIHWAAINNRSDMIEALYEAGSPLAKPCRNRLFANGTPLHLASMNGSLEAAAMLLRKSHELQSHKTRPKTLAGRTRDENNNESLVDNNEVTMSNSNQDPDAKNGYNPNDDDDDGSDDDDDETRQLLGTRDTEGQTPLMRAAAPRSKRMDAIRDLLRKNFWSLSGRPAEMALFLICMGADWRLTEPKNGMNLLHLAIVNDYDDIVSLLLVLDKSLIGSATISKSCGLQSRSGKRQSSKTSEFRKNLEPDKSNKPPHTNSTNTPEGFETVSLGSTGNRAQDSNSGASSRATSTTSDTSNDNANTSATSSDYETGTSRASSQASETNTDSESADNAREPLLSDSSRHKANEMLAAGLTPLQLAILYGRVGCISQLWQASHQPQQVPVVVANQKADGPSSDELNDKKGTITRESQVELQQKARRVERPSQRQMKRILMKACYSNKLELAKFLKPALLKGALVLDLTLLALVWAPSYVTSSSSSTLFGGLFFVSYVLSMALTLRVMLKNPGYLRRNSVQYMSELAKLLERRVMKQRRRGLSKTKSSDQPGITKSSVSGTNKSGSISEQQVAAALRQRRKSTAPLIKLEVPPEREPESTSDSKNKQQQQQEQPEQVGPKTITTTEQHKGRSETTNISQKAPSRSIVSLMGTRVSVDAFTELQDKVRLFCHKCQCIRRPRSRHCNSCNHCVQDFDHHCIYLGCCIGRFNRLDFLMAMVAVSITSIYGTALQSLTMDNSYSLGHFLGFVWIFKYVLIGGFAAFLNLRRACLGVTLYEEIRSKRIRRTFGRAGPPDEINKSHKAFSTLRDSFWRYAPDRFLTGDLQQGQVVKNLREFTNYISPDEYLLTFICTDTPLARSLTSSDSRTRQLYKFV